MLQHGRRTPGVTICYLCGYVEWKPTQNLVGGKFLQVNSLASQCLENGHRVSVKNTYSGQRFPLGAKHRM